MNLLLTLISGWMRRAFFQSAVAMTVIGGGAGEVTNLIDVSDVPEAPVVVDLSDQLITRGTYPLYSQAPHTLAIHHSASPDDSEWETLARFHVQVNKWQAIGYAFGVRDGKRYILRDPNRKGNQVRNNNSTTIGLVVVGNYHTGPMSELNLLVTKAYARELCEMYGYRYIRPHRDFTPTACPGQYAVDQLQDLWIRP
jgi:hypothetical protein